MSPVSGKMGPMEPILYAGPADNKAAIFTNFDGARQHLSNIL